MITNRSVTRFILLSLSVLVICTAIATAQDKPDRSKVPEYQQRMSVNYALVDVVVTDGDGNYLRNLTKEDFELFEDGRRQEILSLDEYRLAPESVAAMASDTQLQQPPRNIIVYLDLYFASTWGIRRALDATEEFVLDRVQEGDQIMILAYYNGVKVIQPFTDSKEKVIKSLQDSGLATADTMARIQGFNFSGPVTSGFSIRGDIPIEYLVNEEVNPGENADAQQAQHLAKNYIDAMESLAEVVKQVKGRKTLILLSEGLPYSYMDPMEKAFYSSSPVGRKQGQAGTRVAASSSGTGSLIPQYKDMLAELNDAKVSVYALDVGGLTAPGSAVDRGSQTNQNMVDGVLVRQLTNISSRHDFLSSIAEETGGRAYKNSNDFRAMLDKVEVDISNYYIIGYRSEFNPERSEYRDIEVKVNLPRAEVHHRKGFFTPVPFENMDRKEKDAHLIEGFEGGLTINQLDAEVQTRTVHMHRDDIRTAVSIRIPAEVLQKNADNRYELEVLASTIDRRGNIKSSVHKRYIIGNPDAEAIQNEGIKLVETLESHFGPNKIQVALRDNHSGNRSYHYFNAIQEKREEGELLLESPIVYDPEAAQRVTTISGVNVEKADKWNEGETGSELLYHPAEGPIFPVINPVFKDGDTLHFLSRVVDLAEQQVSPRKLSVTIAASPVSGKPEAERDVYRVTAKNLRLLPYNGQKGWALSGAIDLIGWPAGDYDLIVLVSDSERGREVSARTLLTLKK